VEYLKHRRERTFRPHRLSFNSPVLSTQDSFPKPDSLDPQFRRNHEAFTPDHYPSCRSGLPHATACQRRRLHRLGPSLSLGPACRGNDVGSALFRMHQQLVERHPDRSQRKCLLQRRVSMLEWLVLLSGTPISASVLGEYPKFQLRRTSRLPLTLDMKGYDGADHHPVHVVEVHRPGRDSFDKWRNLVVWQRVCRGLVL